MSRTFPLSLRPLESVTHKPAAWFIPGEAPQIWVAEMAEWGVPLSDLRLYVVPASVRDRRAIGVLVTGAGGSALNPGRPLRARPYGRLAERLYVPTDAALDPPVGDAELRAKLAWPVYVLHPSAGLVGFAEADALRVHDLLAPPPRRQTDWDRAVPGPPPAPRLLSVDPDLPPMTIEMMLGEGRDDIGSQAPEFPEQPPDGGKVRDALSKAARPGFKAISWLTSHAPGGAGGPTWVNQLQDWANQKLGGVAAALAAARLKELRRLEEMLKADPDKGLRYAIPMGGGRSRGTAPPGASLTPRDVNFNLGRLGGGAPGDAWQVPWEVQQRLIESYREAANRELALGRYRRAAYVFAELLGDLASAASALKQGRHYREAALLYRERLKNPRAAAECLEHGGLLTEAVVLYEELDAFEKAATLYEKLERPDDARRCYRAAVDKSVAARQFVPAARLLETKLDAPDEALGLLDAQWPASEAAGVCLREWFDLLGRLGRHEQASRRLAALRGEAPPPPERAADAARVAGAVAAGYPDSATRVVAADAARVVVGRRLPAAAPSESNGLLDVIRRLAPHDMLLQRDASRYASRRRPRPPAPPPTQPAAGKGPFLIRQFRLPEHVRWKSFSAAGKYFFGCGEVSNGLFLVRGRWDGMVQGMYWKPPPGAAAHVVEPLPDARTLMVFPLAPLPEPRAAQFPVTDAFPHPAAAMTPSALPQGNIVGACVDEASVAWVMTSGVAGYTLSARRPDGTLVITRAVSPDEPMPPPLHMAARNGQVYIASGGVFARIGPGATLHQDHLTSDAKGIAAATAFTRVRIALAMEEGGVLFWEDGESRPFADGMAAPAIGFTRGGTLLALSAGVGRAYRTDGRSLRLHSSFAGITADGPPVAVTPTDVLDQFAVFTADGLVRVMQLLA